MNPAIQNLAISLGLMQLSRKIPFDDPEVLTYVRIGYVVSQVLILAVYYYVSMVIKKKNDKTVLKYVEPQGPMSQEPSQLITTTVRDYDLSETSKMLRSVYMGIAMMGFLHGYMKFNPPLFMQGVMGLKGLYEAKPVLVHILGRKAEGDLKRPWKAAASMFGAPGGTPQTDNAAITEAEKRVGGSKKEE